jgi:hypothetical protein
LPKFGQRAKKAKNNKESFGWKRQRKKLVCTTDAKSISVQQIVAAREKAIRSKTHKRQKFSTTWVFVFQPKFLIT